MIYIITGVSRGLGKAICDLLLERGERVIGIGRSHDYQVPEFTFLECDLSDSSSIEELHFPLFNESVVLINNAGILGEIGRLSEKNNNTPDLVMQVNVVAPIKLLQKAYHSTYDKAKFTVVNISSGAANRAIPSWASYCASKAALNMYSETFYEEEKELGRNCKVYAVAPGVIDTGMQQQIRNANQSDFSSVDKFRKLKEDNELFSSEEAAQRLLKLLDLPYEGEVFYDLRDL